MNITTDHKLPSILIVGLVLATFAAPAHATFLGDLESVALFIPKLLMKAGTALFVILAAVLYVGQYIYTQILIKIAVLMMPIMVPFIMLEKTRFLFEGWMKFLITAGMVKIVGAVLFGLLASNVHQAVAIADYAAATDDGAIVSFQAYAVLMLLSGLTAYIMTQTQQIGNSLVSGFVQGGFRFSPVGQAAAMTKGAAAGAASGLNRAAGGVAGGMSGAAKSATAALKSPGGGVAQAAGAGMKGGAAGVAAGLQKGAAKMLGEKLGLAKPPGGSTGGTAGGVPGGAGAAHSAPAPKTGGISEKLAALKEKTAQRAGRRL